MSKIVSQLQSLTKTLIKYGTPKLKIFIKYARVELAPPATPSDIKEISKGIAKLMSAAKAQRWKQVTVREASLNTLVTIEVICWFYVGECIGKRHIIGYDV